MLLNGNHIVSGGLPGISILIQGTLHIEPVFTQIAVNVPLFFWGCGRHAHTALTIAGHRSTDDLAREADPTNIPPIVPNLDTAINLHAGTLSALVESPSHSRAGRRRDGTPAPTDTILLLDAHLVLVRATFDYLADTGGLVAWATGKDAK